MNMTEAANFIEILRGLGWTGDQIADFQLGIEGRISVEESVNRVSKKSSEPSSSSTEN